MKNQQEEKSSFFFAYGSPQFVLGATAVNLLISSKKGREFLIILGLAFVFGITILAIGLKINEKVATPSYSVDGYFNKWDWEHHNNMDEINKSNFNFVIYETERDSLPDSKKLKSTLDNIIKNLKKQTKDFKLKKIKLDLSWESNMIHIKDKMYPKLFHTLNVYVDYSAGNVKDDWIWDGEKYKPIKIEGDLNEKYTYHLESLK